MWVIFAFGLAPEPLTFRKSSSISNSRSGVFARRAAPTHLFVEKKRVYELACGLCLRIDSAHPQETHGLECIVFILSFACKQLVHATITTMAGSGGQTPSPGKWFSSLRLSGRSGLGEKKTLNSERVSERAMSE